MTMGVPCPHGDVKCLLGDRTVTTSPSVVMDNFLAVKLVAFSSKPCTPACMHLHYSIHIFSPEARKCLLLSRASHERGLRDGACVWVATIHNTSPSLLALNSSRDAHDRTNKCAPLHKQLAGEVFSPEGRRKRRNKEALPEEQAKGLSRDPLQASMSPLQRVLTPQS